MTMHLTIGDVAEQLRSEGLAGEGELDALRAALARQHADDMPWYLRAAVGAGAWAATAFLLAFLFGIQILDGDMTRVVFGIALVAASLWVRRETSAEFMRHASVAASLAGQGLIIVGTGEITGSEVGAAFVGVTLSIATIVLMPDRVHRFLSTLVGAVCAVVMVFELEWDAALDIVAIVLIVLTAVVWRAGVRERSPTAGDTLEPVGHGLVVAVFAILLFSAATDGQFGVLRDTRTGLGLATTLIIGALLLALVAGILREHGASITSPTALAVLGAIVLLLALTRNSPGIIAGIAVLVLGFDRRNPLLVGMAALFLTVFGSVYYYSLSLTLIEKAGVLAASGVVLLLARAVITRTASPGRVVPAGGAQ